MKKKLIDFINDNKAFYSKFIKYPKHIVNNQEFNIKDDLSKYEISLLGIAMSIKFKLTLLETINQEQTEIDIASKILTLSNFDFLYETYIDDDDIFNELKNIYTKVISNVTNNVSIESTDILSIALFEMEAKTGIKGNLSYGFSQHLVKYFDVFTKNISINKIVETKIIKKLDVNFLFNEDNYFIDNNFILNETHLIDISIENNINLSQHLKKMIYKAILFKKFNKHNIKTITYINLRFNIYETYKLDDILQCSVTVGSLNNALFIHLIDTNISHNQYIDIINEYNNIKKSYLIRFLRFYTNDIKFKDFCKKNFFSVNHSEDVFKYPYNFEERLQIEENVSIYLFAKYGTNIDVIKLFGNHKNIKIIYI